MVLISDAVIYSHLAGEKTIGVYPLLQDDTCYFLAVDGGRRKPMGKIDIAVMQSLSRKGGVDPLVEDYGQVIVNERHHVGAASFDAILEECQSTLSPRAHRNTNPQGRSTADYLYAMWAYPTCGSTTGQRAA